MPKKNEIVLLPILLNGKPYLVDPSGNMAITTDGQAIRLFDPIRTDSRFK